MPDPIPGLLSAYDLSDEEKRAIKMQNLWGALTQTGMGLVAAGSPVSEGQRAQLIMQSAQPLANMGPQSQAMMQSASREKLNGAAAMRLAQQDQRQQQLAQVVGSPEFAEQIKGLNPAMQMLLKADPSKAVEVIAGSGKQELSPWVAGPNGSMVPRTGGPEDLARIKQVNDIKKQADNKPLGNSNRDDLLKAASPAINMSRLTSSFKDDYAGYGSGWIGDLTNAYGRNVSDDPKLKEQASWWQDYQNFTNVVRKDLFGTALSKHEQGEFDKANINPGMKPDMVRQNIERQRDLTMTGLSRIAHSMKADGASAEAIELAIGMKMSDLPSPFAKPQQSGGGGTDAPPVAGARKAPDGKWYVPDPNRSGKYLMVQ